MGPAVQPLIHLICCQSQHISGCNLRRSYSWEIFCADSGASIFLDACLCRPGNMETTSTKIPVLVYLGSLILFGIVIVFILEWGQLRLEPHASAPALAVKQTVLTPSVDYSWI